MQRRSLILLALGLAAAPTVRAAVPSAADKGASINYVNALRNADGGYRMGAIDAPSQLAATNSALRAVKYFGGKPGKKKATDRFVESCYDPATGGFANVPGGKPDVRSTAMGLMSMAELKAPVERKANAITDYFQKNARGLPDIYIAAAALDAAGLRPANPSAWVAEFEATRNADGSYGKSVSDTAGAAITILRVGGVFKDRENAARQLKTAQKADGGWSAAGDASDLGTTYRVMRALRMLKAVPDVDKVRAFVARCRNADGGYGASPGQPSGIGPTYFASIVLHWADEMARR